MRELITAEGAAKAIGPYSPALKIGNLLFLSGSIPLDPVSGQLVEGGIQEQTTRVMENIKALLAAAGAGFDNVARTTVFMVDLGEFGDERDLLELFRGAVPGALDRPGREAPARRPRRNRCNRSNELRVKN